ncbi:hypothetical protein BsWGS_04490 [Bradybaena similaris]
MSNGIVSKMKVPSLREPFLTKYLSCRWKLAYLCFLARFIQTALRQCMGIAIIGMTMKTSNSSGNVTNATVNSSQSQVPHMIQEFQWSSVFEGIILASFNLGSIITPIIIGYVTSRHGGRKLMSACLLVGGTFTVLLPVAANANPAFIIFFRIITGMALSGTDSLIQGMWSRWAPLYEKASLSSCAYSGLSVAGILTFLVCGYIISIGGEGRGWPYIFYLFGSMCVLLAPLWYMSVYDTPEDHPQITKQELAIITFNKQPEHLHHHKKGLNTPWRKIFLSSAVWVIVMGHITHKWILTFMLSYLPRYFSDLFDFDLKMNGFFSSLPFVGRVIAGVIAGHVSDCMLRKGVSTAKTRKFFQAIGCWGCAVYTLVIAFVPGLSTVWSVVLLVLAMSCQDLTSVAFRINLLDIAPRYAGILNGVASTIAAVTSLPAPVITSMLISGGSKQGWRVLFCLVAVLNTIGGALYVVFAKGEIQDWAQSTPQAKDTQSDNRIVVFTLKPIRDMRPTEFNYMKRNSLPAKLHHSYSQQPRNAARRATFDFGSMVKQVQHYSFSNLALADLD